MSMGLLLLGGFTAFLMHPETPFEEVERRGGQAAPSQAGWRSRKGPGSPNAFLGQDVKPSGRDNVIRAPRMRKEFPREGRPMTLHTGRHFLQIPGPTNIPDRVLRAMDMPSLDHRGAEFAELGFAVLAGMQRIFRTKQPVIIYPSSGTGAWEAAIVNTLSPGDKVLMAETGQFAVLWQRHRREIQARSSNSCRPTGAAAPTSQQIEARLAADKQHKIKAVLVVHNETSTELRHPSARRPQGARPHQASGAADGRYHLRPRLARIRARRLGHRHFRRRFAKGHDAAAGAELQRGVGEGARGLEGQSRRCGLIGTGTT